MKYLLFVTASVILFSACGGQEYIPPQRFSRRREVSPPPEIPMMERYTYPGEQNRDPFRRSAVPRRTEEDTGVFQIIDFTSLRIAGLLTGPLGNYALISGRGESYIARSGRLFNEDDLEVPGVSVVFSEESLLLITDDNDIYELDIP